MGSTSSTRRRHEHRQDGAAAHFGQQHPQYDPGQPPAYDQQYPSQMLGHQYQQGPHGRTYYPPPMVPNSTPPSYYPTQPRPPHMAPPAPKTSLHSASTVRNQVYLKKASLVLSRCPDAPHLLRVAFRFDAAAPCCVSVFPMAREEGRNGKLVSTSALGPRVHYQPGLNLQFPPDDLSSSELYCINTSVYSQEQLHSADLVTNSYPLVIRIETLGEPSIAPPGTDLATLELGCGQPVWLRSQTTYAVLGSDEASQTVAKVVKQKIWVDNASYELLEIYGLEAAASNAGGDGDTSTECVVCLTNPKNTTVLPCRHFCMCAECAKALLNQSRKCPMCRLNITSVVQIQVGPSKQLAQAHPVYSVA